MTTILIPLWHKDPKRFMSTTPMIFDHVYPSVYWECLPSNVKINITGTSSCHIASVNAARLLGKISQILTLVVFFLLISMCVHLTLTAVIILLYKGLTRHICVIPFHTLQEAKQHCIRNCCLSLSLENFYSKTSI